MFDLFLLSSPLTVPIGIALSVTLAVIGGLMWGAQPTQERIDLAQRMLRENLSQLKRNHTDVLELYNALSAIASERVCAQYRKRMRIYDQIVTTVEVAMRETAPINPLRLQQYLDDKRNQIAYSKEFVDLLGELQKESTSEYQNRYQTPEIAAMLLRNLTEMLAATATNEESVTLIQRAIDQVNMALAIIAEECKIDWVVVNGLLYMAAEVVRYSDTINQPKG